MARDARGCQGVGVSEVVISFQRPASMTESELFTWLTERTSSRMPPLGLSAGNSSGSPFRLCLEVGPGADGPVNEQLTELMMDMRLLGLRPVIVSPSG
jgi:hypothetical protein